MNIERYKCNVSVLKMRFNRGGTNMENVIVLDRYVENIQNTECEWDTIRSIFQSAIKRKGLTKEQVHETSERLLREVRAEK